MALNGQTDGIDGAIESKGLKIAIVGAGIGGLMAAIGLRKNGHDVTVRLFPCFRLIRLLI